MDSIVVAGIFISTGRLSERHADIHLNSYIDNDDGNLVLKSEGNFRESCSNIRLEGTTLVGDTHRGDGGTDTSRIDLASFISNDEGALVAEI